MPLRGFGSPTCVRKTHFQADLPGLLEQYNTNLQGFTETTHYSLLSLGGQKKSWNPYRCVRTYRYVCTVQSIYTMKP